MERLIAKLFSTARQRSLIAGLIAVLAVAALALAYAHERRSAHAVYVPVADASPISQIRLQFASAIPTSIDVKILSLATGAVEADFPGQVIPSGSGKLLTITGSALAGLDSAASYNIELKPQGYLGFIVHNVSNLSSTIVNVEAAHPAYIGDFGGGGTYNTVNFADVDMGEDDYNTHKDTLVTNAFGHIPTLADVVTLVRNYNQHNTGDVPTFAMMPGVDVYLDPAEPAAVQTAAANLVTDLNTVLSSGSAPKSKLITGFSGLSASAPAIVIHDTGNIAGLNLGVTQPSASHPESYHMVNAPNTEVMLLEGADLRGTLYAIYGFSTQFLNVSPMAYWNDIAPSAMPMVNVALGADVEVASPTVAIRAWYIDDDDFLASWQTAHAATMTDHQMYDLIFQTMLRLGLNAIENGSDLSSSTGVATWAQGRGLLFVSSDIGNFANWNSYWTGIGDAVPTIDLSAGTFTPTELAELKQFWQYTIGLAPSGLTNVVHVLQFRGQTDEPFWDETSVFTNVPTADAVHAALLVQAYNAEVSALGVPATCGSQPTAIIDLYSEAQDLYDEGDITTAELPQSSCVVWQFSNQRRNHFPSSQLVAGIQNGQYGTHPIGYYFNVQYSTSGAHLADAEGPWKASETVQLLQHDAKFAYAVTNVGNIREFGLTLATEAAQYWHPQTSTDSLVSSYISQAYSPSSPALTSTIEQLYRSYYDSYWQQGPETSEPADSVAYLNGLIERPYIFQDYRLVQASDVLLQKYIQVCKPGANVSDTSNNRCNDPFTVANDDLDWSDIYSQAGNPSDASAPISQVQAIISGLGGDSGSVAKLKSLQTQCANVLGQSALTNATSLAQGLCFQVNYVEGVSEVLLDVANGYNLCWKNGKSGCTTAADKASSLTYLANANAKMDTLIDLANANSLLSTEQAATNPDGKPNAFTGWYPAVSANQSLRCWFTDYANVLASTASPAKALASCPPAPSN